MAETSLTASPSARQPEVLFAHAYMVRDDPRARADVHPLPPLQPLALAAWIAQQGRTAVATWDSTFRKDKGAFDVAISRLRPRITWIYAHPTTRPRAGEMAAIARRAGSVVIVGGPDARLHPSFWLRAGADAVIPGEGEAATLALVLTLRASMYRPHGDLLARVPGIAWLDRFQTIRHTAGGDKPVDADALPVPLRGPAETRIHLERWHAVRRYRPLAIASARGCPMSCGLCTNTVFSRPYRRRRPSAVADEMLQLQRAFPVDRFAFVDEVFAWDAHWLRELRDEVKRRDLHVPIEASAQPAALSPDIVRVLRDLGCVRIDLDAGSGSDPLLRRLDWGWGAPDVFRAAHALRDAGIALGLRVLIGLPGETKADLDATFELVRTIAPDDVDTIRVDPGSPALFRKDWERVVAGPIAARFSREPALPGNVLDAASAWLAASGTPDPTTPSRFARTLADRLRRPLLRAAVRALPASAPR